MMIRITLLFLTVLLQPAKTTKNEKMMSLLRKRKKDFFLSG